MTDNTGPALGCIADDYTGGTDVAAALRRAGLRTVLLFGTTDPTLDLPPCDAVVVALKTRTIAAQDAVTQTLRVQQWLRDRRVQRLYFKYCSTFDSTDSGNIGPVTDALLDAATSPMTLICPASPDHGRTVYQGHLFVGDTLLSESPMRHHPLTPMTDANLVGVLRRQTPYPVGSLPLSVVRAGPLSITAHLADLHAAQVRHVVVDATQNSDLVAVAVAVAAAADGLPVLTGGAGLAGAAGTVIARTRSGQTTAAERISITGPGIVLAGSCSAATLDQVEQAKAVLPSYRLDPVTTPDPEDLLRQATAWLHHHIGDTPVLIYASATIDQRQAAVAALGPDTADILERILGSLARSAVDLGARRVVVAGGETSGAVVSALGINAVVVAEEEDRGVPWCVTTGSPPLALLLKSGNFGRSDLFVRAMKATT